MHRRGLFALIVALTVAACGDSGGTASDARLDGGSVDLAPDEHFGRSCTNIGKPCTEKDKDGYKLHCVALKGGTAGKGYCTRICNPTNIECLGVPNGLWSSCLVKGEATDAGPGLSYCAFMCSTAKNSWGCPRTLSCGPKDKEANALCLP
ncbi:MAG: hypothetical protein IT371_03000 [Deltaproteobacteria bacterium]|nr:hypothetical protein [Deltaproteobacteria bacterium]